MIVSRRIATLAVLLLGVAHQARAIGDTVNLAARLENANKKFGTNVLISEATWQMLNNVFAGKRLGSITVKGRKEPVTVYAPDISDYLTH